MSRHVTDYIGFSRRADGRRRSNFLISQATGRRRRGGRTALVLAVAAAVLLLLALAGCSGQRPTVAAPADTDTCAVWTGTKFKGGDNPEQVTGARASWVALLMYEATGQELGDTNPGDPARDQAVRVAGRLGLYCVDHPAVLLVDATRTVLAEQS